MKVIIKNKILDTYDIGKFVYNLHEEGLHILHSIEKGDKLIRYYIDKNKIEYKILFIKNGQSYIPKEILGIKIN